MVSKRSAFNEPQSEPAAVRAIESHVAFPVPTTEARLAVILDKVTSALGTHLKRPIQLGRARTSDGGLQIAIWIPGDSFTGVLIALQDEGKRARLLERAVSSQADQVLHTALGLHLSSLEGSVLSVGDRGVVASEGYERALEEEWNDRWLNFVRAVRGAEGDVSVAVVDGDVVLQKQQLEALPKDDGTAFQTVYDLIASEVKRRHT
jgi:hypothetical protein